MFGSVSHPGGQSTPLLLQNGQSGDGGIDGIIKEDRLGLDTIFIQAKRWQGSVGRPEIQKFVGALQGSRTIEGDLKEMMDSFGIGFFQKVRDLYFPHLFSYLFPSWVSALGMSWKIVIMAELLSSSDGIGASLAIARSHLDTHVALALVSVMIGVLFFVEYIILEPMKREIESWRN